VRVAAASIPSCGCVVTGVAPRIQMLMKPVRTLCCSVLLALSTACADGGAGGTGGNADLPVSARYGGTAVIAGTADIQSMNALTSTDAASGSFQQEVLFMPLVRYGEGLEPQPWLAERWDTIRVAPDTLELTFQLRRDVRWHDGLTTTAEDVRFTYEAAIEPRTAFANRASFDLWSPTVEVVDSFSVRFRLRPHADFLAIWYETPIMPAHLLGSVPPAELARHPFGTSQPVGNGPFRFVRRVANQEWVFEANREFPAALGGRPYLDRLVYRVIPEQTTLLTELLTGRIDAYQPNPAQAERIEAAAGVRLLSSPHRSYNYIGWNTRLPLFADARVRRALSLAIDRQAIVDALFYGHGEVGVSTSTPAHWSYEVQRGIEVQHDPEAARRLLREAGWEDRNRDGILRDPQGRPFRFTLVTNHGNDLRRDIGEIVQAQLRRLGIVVEPRTLEWNTLVALLDGSVNERGERERDFEAVTSGWVTNFRKDDAAILHSRNLDGPFQETGFSHPRVDALIDTLAVLMDREAARPLWAEYHRLLIEESPYTVLHYPHRLLGHRERLRGVEMDVRGDLVSVRHWWIHPDERR
jgi:peptide/nickel transport system substrate-binding protein